MKLSSLLLCTSLIALQPALSQTASAHGVVDAEEGAADSAAQNEADSAEEVREGTRTPAKPSDEKWDVMAPKGAVIKQVPIKTDEGSWMDVDVSPDGAAIVFSLLGDIYTMPAAGGTPTRIAEGMAWEVQPRFSPDGRRIAFTSDRGGADNIWIMNVDGSGKVQVTKEDFRLLNQPSWSPDGEFIVAKKHFTTGRSLGTGEVWVYHASGGGGVKLVARPNETHQKELGEPIYSADGKAIFYTRNNTSGPIFEYAQDSTQGIFEIDRYDMETGEISTAVSGYGGAVRPTPSPDGKSIAFVRRDKDQSQLWVKDIASGTERQIYGALDKDVQETWAVTGVYPNMDWTPDSRAIVFWAGGKLRRVGADGSGAAVIPFRIDDTRGIADAPHPVIDVAPDSFTTSIPKFAAVSPDGSKIVFETLGKLYVKPARGGAAKRLTASGDNSVEAFPSWSPSGAEITFVRWNDAGLGSIVVTGANGGNQRIITSQPGHYASPRFSPDGSKIAFEKRSGGYLTSPDWSENPGVYVVNASGGIPNLVSRNMESPQFGASSDRLFMVGREGGELALISTNLDGGAKRVHAKGEMVSDYSVAPNGKFFAFRQNYEAFVMPLMPGTQTVSVGPKSSALPVVKASSGGADYIGWSGGGGQLNWSMGPVLYSARIDAMFPSAPEEKTGFTPPKTGVSMAMSHKADKPGGYVALINARILTMAVGSREIYENGMIIIKGDRITAYGEQGRVSIPEGAKIIDLAGKTVMPGLVDAHAHGPQGVGDLVPQQNWSLLQNLALGTTTIHDPSSRASMIFSASERQRAGLLLGPRIFSTGEIIYGAKSPEVYAEINNYDDALAHVRRIKAQGGFSVKNYNQPRREQRQQVVRAAAAENMLVVAEGGSLFGMDMNLVADGNSTLEHNVPLDVFYEDVLQFFGQSQSNYTPTLVVTYGGLAADPYWRQATDVYDNPLLVHTPPKQLLAATARRTKAPEWAFVDDDNAREAKKLAERGVKVSIGAHGQQAGIGSHWELWSFVRGGMSPMEALRAGTIEAAKSLGMDRDIGSIEAGKLADLVILDADPSADIRNSDKIAQVMLGGRLYDAKTMNEVETGNRQRLPYWWE